MATINFSYFDESKQYYSDGPIEERILENIRKGYYCQDNVYRNWEEFYHFSFFRENILNWYCFEPSSKVLEVGAGLGAITGLLCKKVHKVVALELTKTRAEINYLRNRQFNNLEVVVGDVRDVSLDEVFDYIVLNGVLEYAGNIFPGKNPFKQFLLELEKFSKNSTKIIIAIENRMGIKYFSGAKEDHLGKLFYGINGYKEKDIATTITKKDMENLLSDLGYSYMKLMYPFPDYKFPNEIYSEEYLLNKGVSYETRPFDQDRFDFFDENKVLNKLSKDLKTGYFANSFFVVASKERLEANIENLKYVKTSCNRKDEFKIVTKLYSNPMTQEKWALKKPVSEKAQGHIYKMFDRYKSFNEKGMKLSKALICDETGLKSEYIEGESIEELLLESIEKENKETFLSCIQYYYDAYFKEELFVEFDNRFIDVFGFQENDSVFHKSKINNVDMIFDNVYMQSGKLYIIDYEWMFEFDIPAEFILWRAVKNFFEKHTVSLLKEMEVYSFFEITQEMISVFSEWESHFRSRYIGQLDYNHLYKNLIPIKTNTRNLSKQRLEVCNLFIDTGKGFNDFERISREVLWQEINNFSFQLSQYEDIEGIRFDPIENHLIYLKNLEISIDNNKVFYTHNGFDYKEGILFTTLDPILELKLKTRKIDALDINFEIEYLQEKEMSIFLDEYIRKTQEEKNRFEEENNRLQIQENKLKQCVTDLENSKTQLRYQLEEQEQVLIIQSDKLQDQEILFREQERIVQEQRNMMKDQQTQIHNQEKKLSCIEESLREQEQLIHDICNTRGWKMLEAIRKIRSGKK